MTRPDGISLEIAALAQAYDAGDVRPVDVIGAVYDGIAAWGDDAAWITMVPREEALAAAAALPVDPEGAPARVGLPLYGVPFAVKDNLDVAGMTTTAACADFAYVPRRSATVVERLIAAGAVLIGKNNLDQFATGLSGMRSPYGTPRNPVTPDMVPGGSSSGSAAAVSAGLVSFSIGTDTAGSGRVPAALQSIVGVKPSRGLVSTAGLVPACRSLDCPSVFALTVADGARVLSVIAGEDPDDPWSRDLPLPSPTVVPGDLRGTVIAVPRAEQLGWSDGVGFDVAWNALLARLVERGARIVEIDMAPFLAAGHLLYGGPWIAERWSGLASFVEAQPDAVHPVTRAVLEPGAAVTGAEAFRGVARLQELRAECRRTLSAVDVLVTPTTTAAFTLEQMKAEPVAANAALGRFSTFVNLLDMAAIAVPAGMTHGGVPFGVTLHAESGADESLAALASAVEAVSPRTLGATGWQPTTMPPQPAPPPADASGAETLSIAVVGAHLEGLPLHGDLVAAGATLVRRTATASAYRLFALPGTVPPKPGLTRVSEGGGAIEVEVYAMPLATVGPFLATVPAPLGIGTVELADGTSVHGFVCEGIGLDGARDVTEYGGWRAYLADASVT